MRAFQCVEIEGSNGASERVAAAPDGLPMFGPERALQRCSTSKRLSQKRQLRPILFWEMARSGRPHQYIGPGQATKSLPMPARTTVFAGLIYLILAGAALQAAEVGNPKRGRAVFRVCTACHTLVSGQHLYGPSLSQIWGKKAGTIEGFTRYSEALRHAEVTWNEHSLDKFLKDPKAFIPKVRMRYYGLWDKGKRLDLIAFLRQVNEAGLVSSSEGSGVSQRGKADLLPGAPLESAAPSAAAEKINGRARVIDGDTIIIRKTRIWLHGIDAPEYKQKCSADGRVWSCGRAAKTVLMQAIGTKRVTCVSKPMDSVGQGDRRGPLPAVCRAGQLILNEWMVKMGWAMASRRHGNDYVDEENSAKQKRRGVWAGTFTEPWEWRRQNTK